MNTDDKKKSMKLIWDFQEILPLFTESQYYCIAFITELWYYEWMSYLLTQYE